MDVEVNIINFKNEYEKHFYDLNIEWLNNFFEVEEYDHKILSNAKKYIIDKGGKIFFAVLGDKIIATVALMPTENELTYELTKMAVKPKYRNASNKKNDIVFNEIDIDWSRPIVLVEGVFDAFKAPENTIPLLGSSLSKSSLLYEKIVSNQCEVFLSLDPDMKNKAYEIAKNLSKMGCPVYISFAEKEKDLGQMSKKEIRKLLDSSLAYRGSSELYYKIGKIRSGSVI